MKPDVLLLLCGSAMSVMVAAFRVGAAAGRAAFELIRPPLLATETPHAPSRLPAPRLAVLLIELVGGVLVNPR